MIVQMSRTDFNPAQLPPIQTSTNHGLLQVKCNALSKSTAS